MAILSPKAARERRQERRRHDRSTSPTLAHAFPRVERVLIDLKFTETAGRTPVPQSYVMHRPANAYFEFPCPYADCDGHFDLTGGVTAVMLEPTRQTDGKLSCTGMRVKDRNGQQPCQLQLDYTVRVEYRVEAQP